MTDAEARAKAEEWLNRMMVEWLGSAERHATMADSLAALLRAAGAGTWTNKWTTQPNQEGWHWTRIINNTAEPVPVEIRTRHSPLFGPRLCAFIHGGWLPLSAPAMTGREWSGPLEPPR